MRNNQDSQADSSVMTPDAPRVHGCYLGGEGDYEAGTEAARRVLPGSGSRPAGGTRRARAGVAWQPAGDQR